LFLTSNPTAHYFLYKIFKLKKVTIGANQVRMKFEDFNQFKSTGGTHLSVASVALPRAYVADSGHPPTSSRRDHFLRSV
jgi:hypothetical protein